MFVCGKSIIIIFAKKTFQFLNFNKVYFSNENVGPMETLDRRISASTDQLDTLRREKKSDRSVWGLDPDAAAAEGGRQSRGPPRPQTSASNHVKRPRSTTRCVYS